MSRWVKRSSEARSCSLSIQGRLDWRTKRIVSAKAFLIYRLTGSWIEDYGMASSWGLFNLNTGQWDPGLLALLGNARLGRKRP